MFVFCVSFVLFICMNITLFAYECACMQAAIVYVGSRCVLHTGISVCDRLTGVSRVLTSFRFLRCPVAV